MRVTANSTSAATTMEGPDGVSNSAEANSPPATAATPAAAAPTAICSGLDENRRTVAAGITSSATIRRTPTTLMATAIIAATRNSNARRVRSGWSPATAARSTLTVAASNGRQSQQNTPRRPRRHPDYREIDPRHAENVSEEQAVQIDPHVGKEGEHDETDGEPPVGEKAEHGVGRKRVAPLEVEPQQDDHTGACQYADDEVELEHDGKRDPEQGRVSDCFAEVRETPPDDETSGGPVTSARPMPASRAG